MKILVLLAFVTASISAQAQADFTGNWKLNTEKSDFGNVDPKNAAATIMVVEQKGTILTYQKDEYPKQTLKIDSTALIEIKSANSTTQVSIKPAPDKKGLIETRNYIWAEGQQGVEHQRIRNWNLSDDQKTLTIIDNISTNDGRLLKMVLVYERE